ncbi:MAG: hypothetical protein IT176_14695 [Acidobacteria bacterium]|nr:hypothetical protein [Acidobacteriota bacterium]
MGIDRLSITSDSDAALHRWASLALFPLLVVSLGLAQVRPAPASVVVAQIALAVGQATSILTMIAAMVMILTAPSGRSWPLALVGLTLFFRGLRFLIGEHAVVDGAYAVSAAAAFSAAGALVAMNAPGLVRRQFAVFCALSVPLMLLQMIGVGWTQWLRTDIGPVHLGYQQVPTLFVPPGKVVITTLQSRPAGFLYANNAASLIAVFGLALHYARLPHPGRLDWSDFAITAFVVLLMSRLAFIVLALMWSARLFADAASRRHVAASAVAMALLIGVYWLLFPGLLAANTSWYAFAVDLEIRLVELMVASGVPWLTRLAERVPHEWAGRRVDPISVLGTGTQSAYAALLRHGRLLLLAAAIAAPILVAAVQRFKALDRDTRREVAAVGAAALLVPMITNFAGTSSFWFLSAAAFIPLWRLLDPAIGRRLQPS